MCHIACSVTNNRRSDIARNTAGHQRNVIFLAYSARHAETCAPWKCFIDGRAGVGKLAVRAQRDDSTVDLIMSNVTPINSVISNGARDDKGRWLRGPGRPIGSKNKISSELAKQIRALGPRAIAELAIAIDEKQAWAIQLVIKMVVPARLIELHGSEPADIRDAFENAEIGADELRTISAGLEKLASIETVEELRARLTELEAMIAAQK
ncbi:hypothetical protein NWI01_34330 [Nitrobacter winogradskyi]|uniref:Uncharacterized protein n=2 Tax=Nitrobacter winogradskyi TaxID=913 RepID=A0A4Y3WH59_NITWI|nr:hypothetical protein [Nitrobacter winogradskyi]GEC17541.1 hypothetical protein NWI01_34330 [Nitrobacter winogradskyi]